MHVVVDDDNACMQATIELAQLLGWPFGILISCEGHVCVYAAYVWLVCAVTWRTCVHPTKISL
jgi:hypothetical protein